MSTPLTHRLTYDAPTDAVAAMLADRSFREEVLVYQRVLRSSVTMEGDAAAGDLVVVLDQVQVARKIPSFAKRFVGEEINIVQRESWVSLDRARLHITIPGKPAEINGTGELHDSGGGTLHLVQLDVRVGIPLVGGKIEGLVSDLLVMALDAEEAVGRDYLSR